MVANDLLHDLLERGDYVSIEKGSLVIKPASGKPIPASWIDKHREGLLRSLLADLKRDALSYTGYTTGTYNKGKSPGVTLHFTWLLSGEEVRLFFNVRLTRKRNTRYGSKDDPLPSGRFTAGRRSAFVAFWLRSGLLLPRRLSEFAGYMGNLKPLLFDVDLSEAGKPLKQSLRLLEIGKDQLRVAVSIPPVDNSAMGNSWATDRQSMGNSWAIDGQESWARNLPETKCLQGLQPDQSAGIESANKVLSIAGNVSRLSTAHKDEIQTLPKDQTVDEWLAEYEKDGSAL